VGACNAPNVTPILGSLSSSVVKGKAKCRFYGVRSTGAKTAEVRARIAAAHTVHGRETRAKRAERSAKLAELYELEMLGRFIRDVR